MKPVTMHWLLQRVTAIFILGFFVFLLISAIQHPGEFSIEGFVSLHPVPLIFLFMLFLIHGFMGIKVVMEDYIHSVIIRRISEVFLYLFSILTFIVAFYTIFFVAFSGYI